MEDIWRTVAATTFRGKDIILTQKDHHFRLCVGTRELMDSIHYTQDDLFAKEVCKRLPHNNKILLGGLGFGYTLNTVLTHTQGSVVVAEIIPELVEWNNVFFGDQHLHQRVTLKVCDVMDLYTPNTYDAILLDVDNGPVALTCESNTALYSHSGLMKAKEALREKGMLAVWSAFPDDEFTKRLKDVGFDVEEADHNISEKVHFWFAKLP